MNGWEEVDKVKVQKQVTFQMTLRIRSDAPVPGEAMNWGPTLVHRMQYLVQLTLDNLKGVRRTIYDS